MLIFAGANFRAFYDFYSSYLTSIALSASLISSLKCPLVVSCPLVEACPLARLWLTSLIPQCPLLLANKGLCSFVGVGICWWCVDDGDGDGNEALKDNSFIFVVFVVVVVVVGKGSFSLLGWNFNTGFAIEDVVFVVVVDVVFLTLATCANIPCFV